MKAFNHGISGILMIITIVLFASGNIVLVGTVIYDIIKTDMSFWSIVWDAVSNWLIINLGAFLTLILATMLSSD